ncbi:hypothetical protein N665_3642s0001 [Sinapis alba]|nr:hypothetical protein N665_3642s0001 [Sinapis alba]
MSRNLDYNTLKFSGENYLEWALNTSVLLKSRGLGRCILKENYATKGDKLRAIDIMRDHLTEGLKDLYSDIENPHDLWTVLKTKYPKVLLPKIREEWADIRFQDFESVEEYNYALTKTVHRLKFCGDDISDKELRIKTY